VVLVVETSVEVVVSVGGGAVVDGGASPSTQMKRIAACPVPTEMIDLQSVRNLPNEVLIGDTMGEQRWPVVHTTELLSFPYPFLAR